MNIVIRTNDHCTQISQKFTSIQLAQLIRMYFTGIEADGIALLTTIFRHSVCVLFGKHEVPELVSPPHHRDAEGNELTLDYDTLYAAENAYASELTHQYKQQICKQIAYKVTVFQPVKQASVSQLLLTSSLSIYLLLDIYRDGIRHCMVNDKYRGFIMNWLKSIMHVLFAGDVPTTLESAIADTQGFVFSIDYMGTMALEGQDPLGEHD